MTLVFQTLKQCLLVGIKFLTWKLLRVGCGSIVWFFSIYCIKWRYMLKGMEMNLMSTNSSQDKVKKSVNSVRPILTIQSLSCPHPCFNWLPISYQSSFPATVFSETECYNWSYLIFSSVESPQHFFPPFLLWVILYKNSALCPFYVVEKIKPFSRPSLKS